MKDKLVVEPAIKKASELKSKGAAVIALPMLLDHVEGNAQNPNLIWALGDFYAIEDQPLLGHLYFHALRYLDKSRVDPDLLAYSDEWEHSSGIQVEQDISNEVSETAEMYSRQRSAIPLAYPSSLNTLLNQPAADLAGGVSYFPPSEPGCSSIGGNGYQCGYSLLFGTGDLGEAISSQHLKINYPAGGSDCCTLSLDDPDLRPLPTIEDEFIRKIQNNGTSDMSPEVFERERIGLRVRVLTKQLYVLGYLNETSIGEPKFVWNIWEVLMLLGWAALSLFLIDRMKSWLERRKTSRGAVL